MRKTLLFILSVLSVGSMLSGCFCPYWGDWDGRGYRHDRGYYDRGYDDHRGGNGDYRGRR